MIMHHVTTSDKDAQRMYYRRHISKRPWWVAYDTAMQAALDAGLNHHDAAVIALQVYENTFRSIVTG